MAIKVGGTTVIDDARQLTNVTGLDAATVTAFSDAGIGGGGALDFVASGAISSGDPVGLNTDGTVSSIGPFAGAKSKFDVTNNPNTLSSVYDSNADKAVVTWRAAGPDTLTIAVATVNPSDFSITYGTAATLGAIDFNEADTTFDSNSNKVVVVYKDRSNNRGHAVVGTVSGTSISFGTPEEFSSGESVEKPRATFDSNSNKVVVAYVETSSGNLGRAVVGTVSGTSISFGSLATIDSNQYEKHNLTFDSNSNKVVFMYRTNENLLFSKVGNVSGTSISFGSRVTAGSNITNVYPVFDPVNNKIVVGTHNSLSKPTVLVGTVSGTSISFGSETQLHPNDSSDYGGMVYEPVSNKFIMAYGRSTEGVRLISFSISGNNPVGVSTIDLPESTSVSHLTLTAVSGGAVPVFYTDNNDGEDGVGFTYSPSGGDLLGNLVGFAEASVSDAATGTFTVIGGINTSQTGLTTGAKYYLQDDGNLSETFKTNRAVGLAVSSSSLFLNQSGVEL